jgi:hypothetical protein
MVHCSSVETREKRWLSETCDPAVSTWDEKNTETGKNRQKESRSTSSRVAFGFLSALVFVALTVPFQKL